MSPERLVNAWLEIGLQAGVITALACVLALLSPRNFRAGWLSFALLLMVAHDALLLRLYGLLPDLFPHSDWNWMGKLLATAGLLLVAALPALGWRRSGLTLAQAPRSGPAWWCLGLLTIVLLGLAIWSGDGRDSWDTIAFQWTMPGIQEELFYRGVLLLALNEAFRGRCSVLGARIGWGGLLSTVAFGLIHALFYGNDGVSFDTAAFAMTAGPALLLLWMRERTGSLVVPVLAHNIVNGVFVLF